MAYNEEGQWIGFRPDIDHDDRQALEDVDRLEMAKQYRKAQSQNVSYQQAMNDALMEALKDEGVPVEEWQSIVQDLPLEEQNRAIARGTKKYVRKAVAAARGKKQKGKAAQATSKPKPEAVSEAKTKVEQGGRLTEREELDILNAVLGEDFRL